MAGQERTWYRFSIIRLAGFSLACVGREYLGLRRGSVRPAWVVEWQHGPAGVCSPRDKQAVGAHG